MSNPVTLIEAEKQKSLIQRLSRTCGVLKIMQALFSAGTRQSATIKKDLEAFEEYINERPGPSGPAGGKGGGAGLQGQIISSLLSFSRVIDDYEQMSKRESKLEKKEKGLLRVHKFREDHASLTAQFNTLKRLKAESARSDLLGVGTSSSATGGNAVNGHGPGSNGPRPRYRANNAPDSPRESYGESPFGMAGANGSREDGPSHSAWAPNHPISEADSHALREHSFLSSTENSLDQYIATGRAVLEDLREQGGVMKGTKRRLLDVGVTLGASREVIGWVDRRTKQDAWIFFGGAAFTLFMFWVIWHYLG